MEHYFVLLKSVEGKYYGIEMRQNGIHFYLPKEITPCLKDDFFLSFEGREFVLLYALDKRESETWHSGKYAYVTMKDLQEVADAYDDYKIFGHNCHGFASEIASKFGAEKYSDKVMKKTGKQPKSKVCCQSLVEAESSMMGTPTIYFQVTNRRPVRVDGTSNVGNCCKHFGSTQIVFIFYRLVAICLCSLCIYMALEDHDMTMRIVLIVLSVLQGIGMTTCRLLTNGNEYLFTGESREIEAILDDCFGVGRNVKSIYVDSANVNSEDTEKIRKSAKFMCCWKNVPCFVYWIAKFVIMFIATMAYFLALLFPLFVVRLHLNWLSHFGFLVPLCVYLYRCYFLLRPLQSRVYACSAFALVTIITLTFLLYFNLLASRQSLFWLLIDLWSFCVCGFLMYKRHSSGIAAISCGQLLLILVILNLYRHKISFDNYWLWPVVSFFVILFLGSFMFLFCPCSSLSEEIVAVFAAYLVLILLLAPIEAVANWNISTFRFLVYAILFGIGVSFCMRLCYSSPRSETRLEAQGGRNLAPLFRNRPEPILFSYLLIFFVLGFPFLSVSHILSMYSLIWLCILIISLGLITFQYLNDRRRKQSIKTDDPEIIELITSVSEDSIMFNAPKSILLESEINTTMNGTYVLGKHLYNGKVFYKKEGWYYPWIWYIFWVPDTGSWLISMRNDTLPPEDYKVGCVAFCPNDVSNPSLVDGGRWKVWKQECCCNGSYECVENKITISCEEESHLMYWKFLFDNMDVATFNAFEKQMTQVLALNAAVETSAVHLELDNTDVLASIMVPDESAIENLSTERINAELIKLFNDESPSLKRVCHSKERTTKEDTKTIIERAPERILVAVPSKTTLSTFSYSEEGMAGTYTRTDVICGKVRYFKKSKVHGDVIRWNIHWRPASGDWVISRRLEIDKINIDTRCAFAWCAQDVSQPCLITSDWQFWDRERCSTLKLTISSEEPDAKMEAVFFENTTESNATNRITVQGKIEQKSSNTIEALPAPDAYSKSISGKTVIVKDENEVEDSDRSHSSTSPRPQILNNSSPSVGLSQTPERHVNNEDLSISNVEMMKQSHGTKYKQQAEVPDALPKGADIIPQWTADPPMNFVPATLPAISSTTEIGSRVDDNPSAPDSPNAGSDVILSYDESSIV